MDDVLGPTLGAGQAIREREEVLCALVIYRAELGPEAVCSGALRRWHHVCT